MRTTIDRGGRVVIPKRIREDLGLSPGREVEITVVDGRVEIEPAGTGMRLERHDGGLVAVPDEPLPPLDAETVRATLEQVRR
jgi:AbrB family looped-hinge helix DNA binding protein